MTEPDIEETDRRRFPRWVLIIPVLLIILVIRRRGHDAELSRTGMAAAALAPGGLTAAVRGGTVANVKSTDESAVTRFVDWANEGDYEARRQGVVEDEPYAARGIRLMSDALATVTASRGSGWNDRVAAIRQRADRVSHVAANQQADTALAAFLDATRLIGDLGGRTDELTRAAKAVRPAHPLGLQHDDMRAFFRIAARTLRGLGANAEPAVAARE